MSISRRGNDPAHRRFLEAEDVVGMLMIADLCNDELPIFVAADLDRVPGLYWSPGETDDLRKVRFAHVRETSIELRESSSILRELSDDRSQRDYIVKCPPLQQGWRSMLDQPYSTA